MISQKCQYAIRAIFELAKHHGGRPVKIADLAEAQAIPGRFLEVILSGLKQGGFVESERGKDGGYLLLRPPRSLSVGEVIRFVQGPIKPVECIQPSTGNGCRLYRDCVFLAMWSRAEKALSDVYDTTTFQDLIEEEARIRKQEPLSYAI